MFLYKRFLGALFALLAALAIPYLYFRPLGNTRQDDMINYDAANATFENIICSKIAAALPNSVFPPDHGAFKRSTDSYYSLQDAELQPGCVVQPRHTQEVSETVKVLKTVFDRQLVEGQPSLRFAVRSGGHATGTASSSTNGGVAIDLHRINEVSVVNDRKSVIIGSGARWKHVYSKLEDLGMMVAGGRASDVGIGGFYLGGGISFFSPKLGFAGSTVLEYEIVLADGTMTTASHTKNHDLWKALQGGSNNFGIVTRFTVRSWEQQNLWGGYSYHTVGQGTKILNAFHEFIKPENFDINAAGPLIGFGYTRVLGIGVSAIAANTIYTKPESWPSCFAAFGAISSLWRNTKIQPLLGATEEINSFCPTGHRRSQAVTTFRNDNYTIHKALEIYNEMKISISQVKDIEISITYQSMPPLIIEHSDADPFGLAGLDNTLIIFLISIRWIDAKDDELIHRTEKALVDAIEEVSKSRDVYHPYKYLNYASGHQSVYDGYGQEQKKFLQETSAKYDPKGLFQRSCIGPFKLDMKYM